MGTKGSATQSQQQTYAPSGAGYVQNALNMAGSAAQTPFNMPLQQTAALTDQQNQAFGAFGQAYNSAQPYYQQANNLYGQSANTNVNQYLNPYIDQVTAQMNNLFGQQQAQTTGQLTQAAGGVGADRIAVGQANLANQQALAAGQTYSGIYQNALSAAQQQQGILQNAAAGTASLGSNAQNSALQGAQALYGSGAAQQNQQQNIDNALYQYQLQQAQYPYQQANFYGGLVSSLAGGLGGTTSGQSTSTPAQPSIWSQLLGAGTAATGLLGATGGFGSNGYISNMFNSNAQPNTAAINNSMSTLNNNTGGSYYGPGFAEGGAATPFSSNEAEQPFIPAEQLQKMQTQAPQLNFSSGQQQSSGSSGPGLGDIAKIAMMFVKDGGAIPRAKTFDGYDPYTFFKDRFPREGYDDGGIVDPFGDDKRKVAYDLLRQGMGTQAPDSIPGGEAAPYRLAGPDAMSQWRSGAAQDMANGTTAQGSDAPMRTLAFAPDSSGASSLPAEVLTGQSSAYAPQRPAATPDASSGETPFNIPLTQGGQERKDSFANSPWAALMQAGLGIMGGTSPFAGVNIGQGGMQGLKTLQQQQEVAQKDETIAQSAKRLAQEAKFHEDQYTRMTPYQKEEVGMQKSRDRLAREQFERPYKELTAQQQAVIDRQDEQDRLANQRVELEAAKPFKIGTDRSGFDIMGVRDPKNPGRYLDAVTGEPIDPSRVRGAGAAPQAGQQQQPDGAIPTNAAAVSAGAYNYAEAAPSVEKGMEVPEPAAVGAHSPRSVQADAEYYLQTGKLPPGPRGGKSPTAIQQNDYVNAVRNYAGALAQSRGLTPEQTAEMWRTSPGTLRFVLGQDGRATVSLGTAVRHLDTLKQLSDAWNAGDTQRINQLRAAVSREFGSAAATNLESAAALIGPEIIKALGVAGAGTSQERGHAGDQFSAIRSPAQLQGAIETTQRLLGGQLEGKMRQAAAAGISEEKFKGLIGDRPYELLKGADKGASAPASTLPDAAKAQLKEGQVTTFGNGQRWTLRNGQPSQVQ